MHFYQVAILWRVKDNEVKYTWFENGWCGPKDVTRLADLLNDIQEGEIELDMNAVIPELYGEHTKVYYSYCYTYIYDNCPLTSNISLN